MFSKTEIINGPKKLHLDPQVHIVNEIPNEKGLGLLEQLREHLHSHPKIEEEREYWNEIYDDKALYRFLRARNFDLKKSIEMLDENIDWRIETRPEKIRFIDVREESLTGKVRVSPHFDQYGRSVVVMHNEFENSQDYDRQFKHVIWNLERACRLMKERETEEYDPSRYVVFLNMSNYSSANKPPMSVSKKVANALSTHFPERMALGIIVYNPWIFKFFYNAISIFLDSRTTGKIHFVSEDEMEEKLTFLIGENWREVTGIGQPQVAPNIAPGYDPAAAELVYVEEERRKFGDEAAEELLRVIRESSENPSSEETATTTTTTTEEAAGDKEDGEVETPTEQVEQSEAKAEELPENKDEQKPDNESSATEEKPEEAIASAS